jgi:phage terminase small subunit
MSGVKGKSGGPRKNAGGARPGAGRKPKPKPATVPVDPAEGDGEDTLKLLQDIAFGRVEVNPTQLRAAIAAVQYTHTKRHDGGKKEEAAGKAKEAGAGKFGARPAPLKLVNG